jgi:hypothetical protein
VLANGSTVERLHVLANGSTVERLHVLANGSTVERLHYNKVDWILLKVIPILIGQNCMFVMIIIITILFLASTDGIYE